MKNFKCVFVSVILVLCACNTDDALYPDLNAEEPSSPALQPFSTIPENNANPYDGVGEKYTRTLNQHLSLDDTGFIRGRSSKLIDQNGNYNIVADDPWQTLVEIITSSHLTSMAQTSLLDFIETILVLSHDPYEVLYTQSIRYESQIMHYPRFSGEDKRVILTFTSLVRHTFYSSSMINTATEESEEEPDDDWDNMVVDMIEFTLVALEETPEEAARIKSLSSDEKFPIIKQ